MKKMSIINAVFVVLICFAAVHNVYAECYNEDACFKDYITTEDNNVVIAVNRETNDVELFWSDKDQTWLKPDKDEQAKLQKMYNKKLRLREMQERINHMNNRTMFTTDMGGAGRR